MLNTIKKLLGIGSNTVDFAALVKHGAIILDVRTFEEYSEGHIPGSVNIPVGALNVHSGDQKKTIITCCASGGRRALARRILKSNGFVNVYNGGGWKRLQEKIQQK